ncbi:phosphatase PAP2 family protein [Foetidibacter luteolus]|uniref:phosphatase PAP2 family protein n=1 Tax=Foetidibacter luteolus TaxID=2608880 RepID=UPI00129BFFDD|nr:phosphatase PAP2 family protein [Foetidibacter luteolus]
MKKSVSLVAPHLFSRQDILVTTAISIGYILLSALLVGFKTDQLMLVLLFNTLYYASSITRKFILGFSIFIVYWIIFDYMKAFPNYRFQTVSIESLYNGEKFLFGIPTATGRITPNEFWLQHPSTFLDVLSGVFYLCWVPVPLVFAGYLFYKNRGQFLQFSLTFLLVNLLGFVVYYVYPAAPPWYVQQHGFHFHAATPGNTAGLHRFDDLLHTGIFKSLYSKSSNVFAAMPSLHSAYPLIVFYYGLKNRLGWVNVLLATVMAGIWFAAVYTSHHYILDVLAGILCAIAGIFIFKKYLMNDRNFIRFLARYKLKID